MLLDQVPILTEAVSPPVIQGAEPLAARIARGDPVEEVLAALCGPFQTDDEMVAATFDVAVVAFLSGRSDLGLGLQSDILRRHRLFRVAGCPGTDPLRVLALAAPGDLQMNMPIEFITAHLDIRLDVLFVVPGQPLPDRLPDHDVAVCTVSDSDRATLQRLIPVLRSWPRPVINDPGRLRPGLIDDMTRDGMARVFAEAPGILAPATVLRDRAEIMAHLASGHDIGTLLPGGQWPILIRPEGSHAGQLLERLEGTDELAIYLDAVSAGRFFLSRFIDYRSPDGLFRKSRVALIDGVPFLCHQAVSRNWMIHYLNAGMEGSADKRDDEARAMADFRAGFARRHAAALALLHETLGLDYVLIDCAESPDGRLLLFEVEMAAIIHRLDSPDLFPYKIPAMQAAFAAFDTMLRRAAARPEPTALLHCSEQIGQHA